MEQKDEKREAPAGVSTQRRLQVLHSPKWVRVYFGGEVIAASRRVVLLREEGRTPVYYFPRDDVHLDLLIAKAHKAYCSYKGDASYWTIEAGNRIAENAVWSYENPEAAVAEIAGYMAFDWEKMDAWFEEDEEVFVHPRDPFVRIDLAPSSRQVRVEIGGEAVAETHRPLLLFETGLPTRYYIPKIDTRLDLLLPSTTRTRCPYKGEAGYYSVHLGKRLRRDVAWYYRYPTAEVARIASYVCFFQERVDALYVDGALQPKERTMWSLPEGEARE